MTNPDQLTTATDDARRVLHVEIGPLNDDNERLVRLKRGGRTLNGRRGSSATTLDALARLLSERNIALLKLIKEARPRSVAELARYSGRPKASLTLTLRRLERFGIVKFRDMDGRRKVPSVVCDRLLLDVEIDQDGAVNAKVDE
ncbi:MAG: MarR family transcriptional regulator [Pseudomonadota bacterium]